MADLHGDVVIVHSEWAAASLCRSNPTMRGTEPEESPDAVGGGGYGSNSPVG
jgi:hypothetical protein